MSKKLTIIGKGSVGALSVWQFLNNTNWEIEWIFDENIPVASVGEASNLLLSSVLLNSGWQNSDFLKLNGSPKLGIWKQNWTDNDPFLHPFPFSNMGVHFTADKLQELIYEKVKNNPRLKITNQNIANPENLDSDYVLMCSGSPKNIKEKEYQYKVLDEVPVNSVYVVQCPWNAIEFNYTLTVAMQYGWVFGVPLKDRISIGYLYNNKINSISQIKEDIQKIFKEYNLTPSNKTNHIDFNSYYKTDNFGEKVSYNGNASFFIEPLEATSIGFALALNEQIYSFWTKKSSKKEAQKTYEEKIYNILSMISLHYLAGSKYETSFWQESELKSKKIIKEQFKKNTEWSQFIYKIITDTLPQNEEKNLGTWRSINYKINIEGLNIKDKLIQIRNSTKSIPLNKEKK